MVEVETLDDTTLVAEPSPLIRSTSLPPLLLESSRSSLTQPRLPVAETLTRVRPRLGHRLVTAAASVVATVTEQYRGKKIFVWKYKPKKRYRRRQGHRQSYTRIRIDNIITSSDELQ